MNPDNPYAAPQTLEPQLDLMALPFAELQQPGGQRRRFPDQSTAQLQRLFEKSQPLEAMLLVWLTLWFVTVAFLGALFLRASSSDSHKWLGWILAATVTVRMLCSFMRTKLGRWYMLVVDAALIVANAVLIVGCVTGSGVLLAQQVDFTASHLFKLACVVLITLTLILLAYRSYKTLLQARELFQPVCIQHDDLVRELHYRHDHGIE